MTDILRESLAAERIAIASHEETIRCVGAADPTSRRDRLRTFEPRQAAR